MRHNYTYYGATPIHSPRCQDRGVACPRHAPSPSRDGARPAVWIARLLRSPGSRAGAVRNAAPRRRGGPRRRADGRRLRCLAADVLSNADRLPGAGTRWPGAAEAWAARGAQNYRGRAGLRRGAARGRPGADRRGIVVTDSRPLWPRRAPAESRARGAASGKKTAVNGSARIAVGNLPPATLVASYDL